eukprot:gene17473-20806_t
MPGAGDMGVGGNAAAYPPLTQYPPPVSNGKGGQSGKKQGEKAAAGARGAFTQPAAFEDPGVRAQSTMLHSTLSDLDSDDGKDAVSGASAMPSDSEAAAPKVDAQPGSEPSAQSQSRATLRAQKKKEQKVRRKERRAAEKAAGDGPVDPEATSSDPRAYDTERVAHRLEGEAVESD